MSILLSLYTMYNYIVYNNLTYVNYTKVFECPSDSNYFVINMNKLTEYFGHILVLYSALCTHVV